MPPFYTAAGSLKIRIEVASLLNATLIYYYDYDMPIGSKQSLILFPSGMILLENCTILTIHQTHILPSLYDTHHHLHNTIHFDDPNRIWTT